MTRTALSASLLTWACASALAASSHAQSPEPGASAPAGQSQPAAAATTPGETTAAPAASPGSEAVPATSGSAAASNSADEGAAEASDAPGTFSELLQGVGVSGGLTSEQAGLRAAKTSREAEVKHHEVLSAQQDSRKTFYSLMPRVTATARYTRLSKVPYPSFGSPGIFTVVTPDGPGMLPPGATLVGVDTSFSFPIPLNNYFLNLGVTIPLSDYLLSTTQAMRGSKALREGAELQERAVRADAAAQAKLAYYNWVRSRLQTVVAKQSLEQAEAQLTRMRAYLAAGRVAEADVMQAEAFAAEAQLMVARAQTASSITEEQLRMHMHAETDEELRIGEDVMADFEHSTEAASLDELYREAVSQRLELRSLERTEYSLSQATEVQESRKYPRLEAFGNVTYANPNQRIFPLQERWRGTWDVGVQLVWTINDFETMDADARKTDAERAQMMAQRSAIQDALRVEILSAKGAMQEALIAMKTAQQGHAAAEAALKAREALHAGGRATSLELIQAETTRLQARLNLVEAHIALRVARVQLDHALGRDVNAVAPATATPAAN